MKNKKIIIIAIVIVLLGIWGFYNKDIFTNSEPIITEETSVLEGYDKKAETLERLGFESTEDFANLSDGSEAQDRQVETLKNIFEILDTVDSEQDMVDATLGVALYLNILGEADLAIQQY